VRTREEILAAVEKLHVYERGERRAPHKPLLFLVALANLRRGVTQLAFREVEQQLRPLLDAFAPPVQGSHEPQLPYWYMQNDGLWRVKGADDLPRQIGGFPRMEGLRKTSGGFPPAVAATLQAHPEVAEAAVHLILGEHFPESLHGDILDAVGFEQGAAEPQTPVGAGRQPRSPSFRADILRAYGYRCALTGFHAQLRGAHLGIEAAHVHWHSHGGPDVITNGMALQSTMHKLFDAGVWSLTDDRRVLVSQDLTGADETTSDLRALHGKPIGAPLPGFQPVALEFIRWHREPEHGGVFRTPALPL
jgi:putative restriction endonuclease